MQFVEIRRHSLTKKGPRRGHGSRLSYEGVELARRVGARPGPFDLVFTSSVRRTAETAIAMGFAVDAECEELSRVPEEVFAAVAHHEQWEWREPFSEYAKRLASSQALASFAMEQAGLWRSLGERAPTGGAVLVVTHGGIIEPSLVAAFPDAEYSTWGAPFAHCEGARFSLEAGGFSCLEILRVDHAAA